MATQSMQQSQTCEKTATETTTETNEESAVVLTLRKPKSSKKVEWTQDTVDNEHMGRKKSKCCCVYRKPHQFGESSSESEDDECDHCQGHVELKNAKASNPQT